MDPMTIASIVGPLLGGFLGGGGGYSVPGGVRSDAKLMRKEGRSLIEQSKSPVGSLPQEQAMLATMNALMGQQFGQQREAMGAMNNPFGAGASFTPDMMQNMLQSYLAQVSSGQQGMLQDFQAGREGMRQQGLQNIGDASRLVVGAQMPQQPGAGSQLAGFLGQYAQSQAFLKALQGMQSGAKTGTGMGSGVEGRGIFGSQDPASNTMSVGPDGRYYAPWG